MKQRYLLMPANPTPNGRLHLGHLAGPYLRTDILGRCLKTLGHDVKIFLGTDAFDSYVQSKAESLEISPKDLAKQNYHKIKEDLGSLNIDVDLFINPQGHVFKEKYNKINTEILDQLYHKGLIQERKVNTPYINGNAILSADLRGICPNCMTSIGGNVCENCGVHLAIDDILQLSINGEQNFDFKKINHLFLNTYIDDGKKIEINHFEQRDDFKKAIQNAAYYKISNLKLTKDGDYGLKWRGYTLENSSQLFQYGVLLGEIYAEMYGGINPIRKESDVRVIFAFGLDNIVPHIINKELMSLALPEYKSSDQFIINQFLNLDGEKFSTSRGHAIWGADIINRTPVTSDGLRLYLSSLDLQHKNISFDLSDFIQFYNQVYINNIVNQLNRTLPLLYRPDYMPNSSLKEVKNHYSKRMEYLLQPNAMETALYFKDLLHILSDNFDSEYLRLVTFSIFSYPILPQLSKALWHALGFKQEPSWELITFPTKIRRSFSYQANDISFDDIKTVLPEHLKNKIYDTYSR